MQKKKKILTHFPLSIHFTCTASDEFQTGSGITNVKHTVIFKSLKFVEEWLTDHLSDTFVKVTLGVSTVTDEIDCLKHTPAWITLYHRNIAPKIGIGEEQHMDNRVYDVVVPALLLGSSFIDIASFDV